MAKKTIIDQFGNLIALTVVAGFGWIAIRGFASFFDSYSPMGQLAIGIIGAVVAVWIFREMFGIKIKLTSIRR